MDRSRCTEALEQALDRNARFWERTLTTNWCPLPLYFLGCATAIIYLFALLIVLMAATVGGTCLADARAAGDPVLLENGWVVDVVMFSIQFVQIVTLGAVWICCGSALLAAFTLARRKRQEGA